MTKKQEIKPEEIEEIIPEEVKELAEKDIKDLAELPPKEIEKLKRFQDEKISLEKWEPKTKLGLEVKNGKIKSFDYIIEHNLKVLEPEIIDILIPIKFDLISIGQSKGKFGGGKRRAWRQTQRKTEEGNVPTFSAMAVVGDENGHIGIGVGRAAETLPARDKAIRKAKLNLIKVERSCASFDCDCSEKHTVPFIVSGKAGSVSVTLMPAPQGTGLVAANELKKILKLAGIKDVYSRTFGSQRTSFNFAKACVDALNKTNGGKKNVSDN
jgi:small subunit ribosomal protein S5